jgi:uncharacterized protein YdcH (DUF465 family)
MLQSTATVSLKLDAKDFSQTANDVSTQFLGIQLAAGGASLAFKGLGAVARTSIAEIALGGLAVEKLSASLNTAAINSGKLSGLFGQLSSFAVNAALVGTAVSGVTAAVGEFTRIPQTLAAIQASGVSTRTIEDFQQMREAILGSQASVDGFVNTAIARLGQFEQAAARSATILKSSTRFDDSGNALRVNARESMENALSIQNLVNTKLDNAVSSGDALLAQYEVLSGGFSKQVESEQVLEAALKLTQISKAGGVSANTAENTKLITKSLQAYSLGAGDAAKTGAILNAVVENGITTVQELSNGFGAAGASASKAGISMSALGSGVAVLTSIGQDTSEALTGLKGLSDSIINKTPEAAAELAKLTFEGKRIRFDTAEVQAKGFTQALIDLYKAAGNSPQTLAKIFPDAISYRAAIGLLTADGAKFKSTFESVNSASAQSLDDVAKLASGTRIVEMEKLANKFGEIIITIAQSLVPVVEPGLKALKQIADGFNALPDPIKQALGSWIAAQITVKAAAAGFGELGKALLDLAGIYAITRVIGLAMGGQLGSEVMVLKELIVQRKGLGAVMLQAIGVDQRYRLGVNATSEALKIQGVVAATTAKAQAKAGEMATSAAAAVRGTIARNVANAQTVAAELAATRGAGAVVNAGTSIGSRAIAGIAAVNNSQTAQNIRASIGQFTANNPGIGVAATEIGGIANAGIARVRAFSQAATASILGAAQTGAAVSAARSVTQAAESAITPPTQQQLNQARLNQLSTAELNLKSPKLLGQEAKLSAELAKIDAELEFKERTRQAKREELLKRQDNYVRRTTRLEEIEQDLSPGQKQRSIAKLNKDAAKITALEQDLAANAQPLADLQRQRAAVYRQVTPVRNAINTNLTASDAKFAPLVALEPRIVKVSQAAAAATQQAVLLEQYATNLARISPGTAEATAALTRATNAAIKQSALIGTTQRLQAQYDTMLAATGGRTALLASEGLKEVRFGGQMTTVSNTGLQNLLYADVGKAASNAFKSVGAFITAPLVPLGILAKNAVTAAIALGNLAKSAILQPIGTTSIKIQEALTNFTANFKGGLLTAFKEGGLKGILTKGFDGYISGAAGLGQKALPFLPAPIAGAAAVLSVPVVLGAVTLRDDFKRNALASEFQASVTSVLAKDRELADKFGDRTRPLDEVRAAVFALSVAGYPVPSSEGKDAKFTARTIPTTAPAPAQGALSTVLNAPSAALNSISRTASGIGSSIDRIVADPIVSAGSSSLAKVDPIREQLKLLANSGELTAEQFKNLDTSLSAMGKSGKITADELQKFTIQIDTVRSQVKPKSKGVVDTLWDVVTGAPGRVFGNVLGGIDNVANTIGAGLNLPGKLLTQGFSAIDPRNFLQGLNGNKAAREADSLIRYIGDNGSLVSLNKAINAASDRTKDATTAYAQGGAIDLNNAAALAAGKTLTASDIEREGNATKSYITRNQNIISDYDNQLKNLNETLEKTQDPGNRSALTANINALEKSKEQLEKNTSALKLSADAFAKYNLETLPGLIRALKETKDPNKAIALAEEDFNQQFQKGGDGKITAYTKNIAELRQDSSKFVDSVMQKYQIDNSGDAESAAIDKIKLARDNQITLSTGDSGYRETIAGRLALTDSIVKIQATASERTIAIKTLENEKIKVLNTSGGIADREAQIESERIALDTAQNRLTAKEQEIREYAEFPKKVVELEQQAATMRVQIEGQVAATQKNIRDRAFTLDQARYDLRLDYLKTAESREQIIGIDGNLAQSRIEIEKTSAALQKLYADRQRLTVASPELDDRIAKAEQQIQQQKANVEKTIRERTFSLGQSQYDLRLDYLKTAQARLEVGGVSLISSQSTLEIEKANSALQKLYADRQRLTVQSPELDDRIAKAEQQIQQQKANGATQIFDGQIALKQKQLSVATATEAQPLTIANKQIELAQKLGEIQGSIASANKDLLTSQLEIQTSQLDNESKLSRTTVERADIELKQSKLKLDSLGKVQIYERESLVLQLKLSQLSLDSQANQIKISRLDQQKAVKEIQLQQLRLDRDKSNTPEIAAQRKELELQLSTAKLQLGNLEQQEVVISRQAEANREITTAKLKQNDAQQINAKQTAGINVFLSEIATKTTRITEATERQNLVFTAQTNQLNARVNVLDINTKQLDNQTKILQTQQGLVSAIADSRVAEVNILNELTTIESTKLNLAQRAATIKLASLDQQLVMEKQLLEISIERDKANLAQDKIKQQISLTQGQSDILGARSSLEKLQVDPRSNPLDIAKAELDLSAKEQQYAYIQAQGKLLDRQDASIKYTADVQRYQLELTQKTKSQQALLEYGKTLPIDQSNRFENKLSNAIFRDEGLEFFRNMIRQEVRLAPDLITPYFNSPYDPNSNYNRLGIAEPTKAPLPTSVYGRTSAGSLNLTPPIAAPIPLLDGSPDQKRVNLEQFQLDAKSRYEEFTARPVKVEISSLVKQVQQEGRFDTSNRNRQDRSPTVDVKPITVNLQMTNNTKIDVANSAETKDSMLQSTLGAFEGILRLVKEKY